MKRSTILFGLAGAMAAPVLAFAQVPERPIRADLDPAVAQSQLEARAQARQEAQATGQNGGFRQGRGGGGQNRAFRGQGQAGQGAVTGQAGSFPAVGFQGGASLPVAPLAAAEAAQASVQAPVGPGGKPASVDPLAGLGGKVSAVLDIATSPRLLITETEYGVSDTSDLVVGQEYRDGWRLAAINPASITMKKGEASRQIALNLNIGAVRTTAATGVAGGGAGDANSLARNGPVSISNGSGQAGVGRGGPPGSAGGIPTIGFGQLAITPEQLQRMQGQIQSALANLPPSVVNDPRAAAALSALQSGNIGDLITQFQGAEAAGGSGGAAAPFIFRLGPGGVPATVQ